jgi:hypothetical protein
MEPSSPIRDVLPHGLIVRLHAGGSGGCRPHSPDFNRPKGLANPPLCHHWVHFQKQRRWDSNPHANSRRRPAFQAGPIPISDDFSMSGSEGNRTPNTLITYYSFSRRAPRPFGPLPVCSFRRI